MAGARWNHEAGVRPQSAWSTPCVALDRDDGIALLVAMAIVVVMSALSSALILWTMTEAQIAKGFGLGVEGRYAAGAAAERALIDLAAATDWNAVLDGSIRSTFTDGAPTGTRRLADDTTIDLEAVRNAANCGHVWACSESELAAVTSERPWGPTIRAGNCSPMVLLATSFLPPSSSSFYIVVLVADDPSERDGNPSARCADPTEPGAGIDSDPGRGVRAARISPGGGAHGGAGRRGGSGPSRVRVMSWRGLG